MSYDNPFVKGDEDLYPILKQATDNELEILAKIISKKISSDIDANCRSALKIASEIQLMGGNSIANKIRGHGVCYREIALDVARDIGIENIRKDESIEQIEWKILSELLSYSEDNLIDMEGKEALYIRLGLYDSIKTVVQMTQMVLPSSSYQTGLRVIKSIEPINIIINEMSYSVTMPCVAIVGSIRVRIAAEQAAKDIGE